MSTLKPVIIPSVPIDILLISDNDNDGYLLDDALSQSHLKNRLVLIQNTNEVIPHLKECQKRFSLPGLIMLNVGIQGDASFDCLHKIRTSKEFMTIPIVVLTSNLAESTLQFSINHGVTGYFLSPVDPGQMRKVIKDVEDHWALLQRELGAN